MQRIQTEKRTDLKSEIPLEAPYCLFVDPSSACNFKCKFCMNSRIKRPITMHLPLFTKIVDDLEEFKNPIKTLRLYGFGEPLLNPNFCKMVCYAKASEKVLSVDTTSNASLLSPDLILALTESGLDRINVSVSAMNTDAYRAFTGNSLVTFEGIVEKLTRLYRNKPESLIVFIKADGDLLSEEEKKSFIDTFGPISDGHALEHTMNCWRDFDAPEPNKDVGIYGQPLKEVLVCPYVFYSFFIHADGYASSCFLDWNKKLILGDVKEESVKELWNAEIFNAFRISMLNKDRKSYSQCANCNQLVAGMPVDLDAHATEIMRRMI